MIRMSVCVSASLVCALAQAAPHVFTEQQRIELPPAYASAVIENLALDGDQLLVMGAQSSRHGVFAYEPGPDGVWRQVQTVLDIGGFFGTGLALRGGVAASDADGFQILEKLAGAWQVRGDFGPTIGAPFAVSGSNLFATTPDCEAQLFARSSAGTWLTSSLLPGARNLQCYDEWFDIEDATAVAANRLADDDPIDTRLYQRDATGSWQPGQSLPYPPGVALSGSQLSMRSGRVAAKASPDQGGDLLWGDDGAGNWSLRGRLQAADAFESRDGDTAHTVRIGGGPNRLIFQLGNLTESDRHGHGVVRVFRENFNGTIEHLATLQTRDGTPLVGPVSASATGIVVAGGNDAARPTHAYYFRVQPEYPSPLPLLQADFNEGTATDWRATSGSAFSVASDGITKVYRQSSVSRSAGAEFTGRAWPHGAIEADIIPRSFAGPGRWVGLMSRRLDGNNFYYVALQPPDTISFKRVQDGVTTVLRNWSTSGVIPILTGRRYRLRLESLADRHRIYLDGILLAQTYDDGLPTGRFGLVMYQASADYDNVILSGGAQSTLRRQLFEHSGQRASDSWWTNRGTGRWTTGTNFGSVTQGSLNGSARRLTGAAAGSQSVSVTVRPTSFAIAPPSADPWVGLVARYANEGNYYQLSLHDSNRVVLRKRVGDHVTELASAALDVSVNQTYALKLEAIDDRLRVFVDNRLVLEASDDSLARGSYGLATHRATARFNGLHVYQP